MNYLKQRDREIKQETESYNRWYNTMSPHERNKFEIHCRANMTDQEYNANPPLAKPKHEMSIKDMEMFIHLMEGNISELEWLKYKSPVSKAQMMEVAKIVTIARKIIKTKKQASCILTKIS